MKEMKFGLIGCGCRGGLAKFAHNPEIKSEIIAVADIDPDGINKWKNKHNQNARGYTDYREMIEKETLNGVFILSPDYCHEEQAVFAIENALPVYLEKPMAISIKGCDRIMKTAKKHKQKIMLGHNMRYMGFVHKIKEIIDAGTIGDIKAIWCRHFVSYGGDAYFKDWHAEQRYANSLLLQKGAHDIDIIHWLANSYTANVVGMGKLDVYDKSQKRKEDEHGDGTWDVKNWPPNEIGGFNPNMDVEDHNMILMNLQNGIQASYLQCHYTPDAWRNYTVIGSKGRIENYGDFEGTCNVELWTSRKDGYRMNGNESFDLSVTGKDHGGSDRKIVEAFVEYLRDGKVPFTSPQASRYSVAVGCQGAESIRNHSAPYKVPNLPDGLEEYIF